MRIRLLTAIVLAVASVSFWPANAATYYVSPSGSDSNSGTTTSRFRTVAKAVSVAVAGDTIILGNGTYGNEGHVDTDPSGGSTGWHPAVTISSGGNSSAWITLQAETKWGAVLDCGVTSSSAGCDTYLDFYPSSASYWIIKDLVITRSAFTGIHDNSGASHLKIIGNRIENIGNIYNTSGSGISGIGFNQSSTDIWIEGNVIHDIGRTGGSTPNHDHGIYANGSNATIINNIFYHNVMGWDIQAVDYANNWVIANNTFAFSNPSRAGQIVLYGGNYGGSVPVYNVTIQNNIFYQPGGSYAVVTNNAVPLQGCTIDHNLVYGSATQVIDEPGWCHMGTNQIGVDPKLVNASTVPYDFHLQTGSPAIGAGTTTNAPATDYDGNTRTAPITIGAYQVGGSGGGTPPPSLPVISLFSASPQSIIAGSSTTLSWATTGATALSIDQGIGTVTGTTSKVVTPAATTNYTLSASNTSGTVHATVTIPVTIGGGPGTPPTATWPGTRGDLLVAADHAITTLAAQITDSDLSVPVASISNFVAYQVGTVDSEQMKICGANVTTLTICAGGRGFAGTAATAHQPGAIVAGRPVAVLRNVLEEAIIALETVVSTATHHGTYPGTAVAGASWPDHVATALELYREADLSSSRLSAGITASDTTIALAGPSTFVPDQLVLVDQELIETGPMLGSAISGAIRGLGGTVAISHPKDAAVIGIIAAIAKNRLDSEVAAVEADLWLRAGSTQAGICGSSCPAVSGVSWPNHPVTVRELVSATPGAPVTAASHNRTADEIDALRRDLAAHP